MKKKIDQGVESRVCFEQLEDWVRQRIQGWIQEVLEEEVTELLGRQKVSGARASMQWPGIAMDMESRGT